MGTEMKRSFLIALVATACLTAAGQCRAQAAPGQNPPANSNQKPASTPQTPQKPADANPFPEDTSTVPVMPSKGTAALPEGTYGGEGNGADSNRLGLKGDDVDPVRSPDDAAPAAEGVRELESSSSSSRAGLDKLLPGPDDDDQPKGKKGKVAGKEPEHVETSKEDLDVGKYYLEIKNWKAALSRFESAMVLAPDEPEVYWGLAESERNLGHFAEARTYYLKLLDYDPDGPHGKAARKALKDPEVANAKAATPAGETVK